MSGDVKSGRLSGLSKFDKAYFTPILPIGYGSLSIRNRFAIRWISV